MDKKIITNCCSVYWLLCLSIYLEKHFQPIKILEVSQRYGHFHHKCVLGLVRFFEFFKKVHGTFNIFHGLLVTSQNIFMFRLCIFSLFTEKLIFMHKSQPIYVKSTLCMKKKA